MSQRKTVEWCIRDQSIDPFKVKRVASCGRCVFRMSDICKAMNGAGTQSVRKGTVSTIRFPLLL